MSAPTWDVTSEAAAEAFETWIDRLITFGAPVCEGLTPLASQQEFKPVADAWQAFNAAMAAGQEDPDV